MAVWYFLRLGPGDLRPLSAADMESFLRAEVPLPADEEHLVHYVGLEVQVDKETVMDLGRVWFGRCKVHENGLLDQRTMLNHVNARLETQRRLVDWIPGGETVIDASDAFTAKRLHHATRWEPSRPDI